jgi:tetratricopeptide (TPR) repeat protein
MKFFLASIFFLAVLLASAGAQPVADEKYLQIYGAIQQGDDLAAKAGQEAAALTNYSSAQDQLLRFQKIFPDWNPAIINFRLSYLSGKISELKPIVESNTPPVLQIAPSVNLTDSQLSALNSQLRAAQTENEMLQTKLKEALTAQPAAIDSRELTEAQEQLREMMKENDLLKATHTNPQEKIILADTNRLEQARAELAASAKKFSDEHSRASQLVTENDKLRTDLKQAVLNADAVETLRSENMKLKEQLDALKLAADEAEQVKRMNQELHAARAQIAQLQSAMVVTSLEKSALEKKYTELINSPKTDVAEFQKQIHALAQERDELMSKLNSTNRKKSKRGEDEVAAQVSLLNDQVSTLRSRIQVDEAKAVPFSTEELTLFRQAAPVPEPTRKSVKELPAGTSELVASAQKHFSQHEFSAAEADYKKILDRDENNGLALANLATIELQEDKFADAEKHINAAIAQNPDDAYNLSTLGYLKFREEKYDEALDALSKAAKIDPENPEIQNYLGVTLSHKGLRAQGETALRKAIQINPNFAPAHNNLAVIYLSQTPPLPQLARWHYQKALDAGQPRNPELEKMLAAKGAPVEAP